MQIGASTLLLSTPAGTARPCCSAYEMRRVWEHKQQKTANPPAGTARPCVSAYSIRRVRELRSHSRQGAMTLMSGFRP